ncbi:hypothetical protein, partial [Staphylococcus aureus]|uniref:hypothetical protein n=1 Tax=Staphylococcus aureus TaxID=1280 RepID=UPI0038B2985E
RVGGCVLLLSTSTVQAAVSQPQIDEQLECEELQEVEETSVTLALRGKRARRPPPFDTSSKTK